MKLLATDGLHQEQALFAVRPLQRNGLSHPVLFHQPRQLPYRRNVALKESKDTKLGSYGGPVVPIWDRDAAFPSSNGTETYSELDG